MVLFVQGTISEIEMNGVSHHDAALLGYIEPGTTWADEMNFVVNHAPGAGSITRRVDQQSSVLPLYLECCL